MGLFSSVFGIIRKNRSKDIKFLLFDKVLHLTLKLLFYENKLGMTKYRHVTDQRSVKRGIKIEDYFFKTPQKDLLSRFRATLILR